MQWSTDAKVHRRRRQMSGTTKGRWFKWGRGSHVGASVKSLALFLCKKQSSPKTLLLLFRKKARSIRLLACKRTRDGSLSLPPFCELKGRELVCQWSTDAKALCRRRQMSGTTKGRWSGRGRGSHQKRHPFGCLFCVCVRKDQASLRAKRRDFSF